MTIYFVGGEMSSFVPSGSNVLDDGTDETHHSASFSRTSINIPRNSDFARGVLLSGITDAWIHFVISTNSLAGADDLDRFYWYDSSGTEKIRMLQNNATDELSVQYHNGSTWVQAGSSITLRMSDIPQTIDLNIVCNTASGSINLYVAGTLRIASGTIDLSGATSLKNFTFHGDQASTLGINSYASQVIVADEPTIGMRVGTVYMSGNGATTDWTNTYLSIDETVYSDADFIYSSVADQVELYTGTSIASLTGYTVRAVAVTARAKKGASGPANLQLALRSGGTTYFSASRALTVGYAAYMNVWETDPATGSAWLSAAISSLQYGVKSIT